MALFLLGGMAILRFLIFTPSSIGERGVFGGPVGGGQKNDFSTFGLAMLAGNAPPALGGFESGGQAITEANTAYLADSGKIVADSSGQGSVAIYRVKSGDNLGQIAKQFG
ncbi:MAG: LysM domain-containing protein, partial [Candidatus Liptonbacteria bacterium]|nr:LysM domain-containing protein [Candidatus Liptonbacteria bacterium]